MPKLKTNKAASKRYKYTASGKVKRTKANRRQLKNYYLMVTKNGRKEGYKKWQE